MKTQILKLLWLKQLYGKYACGECFTDTFSRVSSKVSVSNDLESMIKNCSLCNRIKHCKEPIVEKINQNANICFISEIPLIDATGNFVQNKSAVMLKNIIEQVFNLPLSNACILSLVKCDAHNPHIDKSEILSCMGFCISQLQKITPKICILLGKKVAEHILGQHLEAGRILWHNNKRFLATYSLNELVRNPSLKREAYEHFLTAKGQL